MKSSDVTTTLIFCLLVCKVTSKEDLDLKSIISHLKKMCLENPNNIIKDPNVKIKCRLTFDLSCWKETQAGDTFIQPCPFLFYSTKDNVSRRCDERGKWQKIDITKCHRLKPKEAVGTGKRISNITVTDKKDNSLTHTERVQNVYVAFSWVAFSVILPTFVLICIIMRKNDRFTLHKNLILAFVLRNITLFIHYHGKMGDKDYNKTVCNVFWVLNRYFAASEITWMLSEGIFLLRMLVYPFDSESYFVYYILFGWGFSGVLLFCVYLPYVQFAVAKNSERCWVNHSHTTHMLVLYVPLTIMLLVNFGIAAYVMQMLARKLKNSQSSQMTLMKKSAKAVVILISLLGLIYLLTFYNRTNSGAYDYFVAVVYPFQGILVCIFCVYLSVEFRESLRRHWMKWRYGILIETSPYSASAQDIEPGPSGEQRTSAAVMGTEPSDESRLPSPSHRSLHDSSRPSRAQPIKNPEKPKSRPPSEMSLLSISSDLTKYRQKKVEPEPLRPLRVQSAGPEAWCPPTLQDAAAAWGEVHPPENQEQSGVNQSFDNKGFSAKSEADLSHFGSQISLELKTYHTNLESVRNGSEEQGVDMTATAGSFNSSDEFSLQSLQFEHDTGSSTAGKWSGGEMLETATAGSSINQDAGSSRSEDDSSVFSRSKQFWEKARKLSDRRRSMLDRGKIVSKENESSPTQEKYAEKQKDANTYRLAWITSILRGDRSRETESDA